MQPKLYRTETEQKEEMVQTVSAMATVNDVNTSSSCMEKGNTQYFDPFLDDDTFDFLPLEAFTSEIDQFSNTVAQAAQPATSSGITISELYSQAQEQLVKNITYNTPGECLDTDNTPGESLDTDQDRAAVQYYNNNHNDYLCKKQNEQLALIEDVKQKLDDATTKTNLILKQNQETLTALKEENEKLKTDVEELKTKSVFSTKSKILLATGTALITGLTFYLGYRVSLQDNSLAVIKGTEAGVKQFHKTMTTEQPEHNLENFQELMKGTKHLVKDTFKNAIIKKFE